MVLAVFVGELCETAQQYMEQNGYDFPAAVDTENRLRAEYAPRLPTSYLIDSSGNIVARIKGNQEWDSDQGLGLLWYLLSMGNYSPDGDGADR